MVTRGSDSPRSGKVLSRTDALYGILKQPGQPQPPDDAADERREWRETRARELAERERNRAE